jgi:hypothetical protein
MLPWLAQLEGGQDISDRPLPRPLFAHPGQPPSSQPGAERRLGCEPGDRGSQSGGVAGRRPSSNRCLAFPAILDIIARAAIWLTDEEAELMDRDRSWIRRHFEPVLPWRDSYGKPVTLDLKYILPLGGFVMDYVHNGTLNLPFITGGPVQDAAVEQITGRDLFTGRDWTDTSLLSKERGMSLVRNVAPVPSFVTHGTRRMMRSLSGASKEDLMWATLGTYAGFNARTPYVAEQSARQAARDLYNQGEFDQVDAMIRVWNEQFKPDFLEELTFESIARGAQSSRSQARNRSLRKAAEHLMRGNERAMERELRRYGRDKHEDDLPLTVDEVEYQVEVFKSQGKTR